MHTVIDHSKPCYMYKLHPQFGSVCPSIQDLGLKSLRKNNGEFLRWTNIYIFLIKMNTAIRKSIGMAKKM
jgi:hypothetical protein